MTDQKRTYRHTSGHRMALVLILCLFGLCLVVGSQAARKRKAPRKKVDERVYLADKVFAVAEGHAVVAVVEHYHLRNCAKVIH